MEGREGREVHRLERMSYQLPGEPEQQTLPGEDGLGLEIWDDHNYKPVDQ